MDTVAFGLHLVGSCTVKGVEQFRSPADFRTLIGGYIEYDRRVVADPLHRRGHVIEVYGLVMRVAGVTGHPEFLPDHDSVFITQLVEQVAFGNAASPKPEEVDAGLVGVGHLGAHAVIVGAEHRFRYPVAAPDEHPFTVDNKHLRPIWSVGCYLYVTDPEGDDRRVGNLAVNEYFQIQLVEILGTFVLWPPETGIPDLELGIIFRCEGHFGFFPTD